MNDLLNLQKKLYPDLLESMHQRYAVLRNIYLFQPIGRRGLAEHTKLTERIVRGEVTFLQKHSFIHMTTKGMQITKEGKMLVEQLAPFMSEFSKVSVLQERLKDKLQIKQALIVPGNSDEDNWVKQEMGKVCVSYLKQTVQSGSAIAVTGGTTIAAVADVMTPIETSDDCLFVPARGGIGERMENQANSIVAKMARKAKGDYRLLYVPDTLSETSYQTMINEPAIKEVLQKIKSADIVLHGIGDALTMAARRNTPEHITAELKEKNAVSEAFGYYFDNKGEIVHKVRTIGLQLEDVSSTPQVIAIAGGKSKAKAIVSYFMRNKSDLLITDEAVAEAILRA
ncbi:sugar-binding transcriptional regulator [Virgibacillus alimentarius]|uniref:Central glycolytic genes regulator n=1 Tax=Virgibacillus alimentarius TaxID=698769 RepID=A0ABS4S726_9BACI|nr:MULTISPECIES: sugar-binding domain-containing protein [Virgibacillus]MBP2256861.1 central glycolytic genes regulator [Virgibacillus alimentarius]HLR69543.1 sugar-binding domain-containing protein [Virgibacillus sp.]